MLADGRTIRTKVSATGDAAEDEKRAAGWTAVRAADLSFVRTQLARIHSGEIAGPLTGHLDTSRVVAAGHSLGGAAALQAARQDPRFASRSRTPPCTCRPSPHSSVPWTARRARASPAAASLAFLDSTLRDTPGDPATALSAYGTLVVHHPGRSPKSGP
ncbi:hypothetical protein ACFVYT_37480 [Streptomyces sp. NPDC058290]|uniref:hypothetical protein n=1 Tax=Streptomyces sp. NPDC058290 TaxID=3346426 RepID=UPI0036E0B4F9